MIVDDLDTNIIESVNDKIETKVEGVIPYASTSKTCVELERESKQKL